MSHPEHELVKELHPLETATRYNPLFRERYWQDFWDKSDVFKFVPTKQEPIWSVDTPPPTASGSLHIGHVFSYTHAAVVIAFMKMNGYNIRNPICYDNNGMPTEILVAKALDIKRNSKELRVSNPEVTKVVATYKRAYADLWRSLGMGMDDSIEYSTISPGIQIISQNSFTDLFEQGLIYEAHAPSLYCCECCTPIAQAEIDDKEKETIFYTIDFKTEEDQSLSIATTRPELLPAIQAVFVNPEDKRYNSLVGRQVFTPLGDTVTVIADSKVAINKGTGAVMCCSYGDETDLSWIRKHGLGEKVILDEIGRFIGVNQFEEMNGLSISNGRLLMVEKLKSLGVVVSEREISHTVGVHERCGTPIEIFPTSQWFVKVMEIKEQLVALADTINWHPPKFKNRFVQWVNNLKWDWSISRTRQYGIPVPAFHCDDCEKPFVVRPIDSPIDPREIHDILCPHCQSQHVTGSPHVLDTWFTSAQTPKFNDFHPGNGELIGHMGQMAMRPMAHDIIQTWALYSIVKSYYENGQAPWKDLMISGHILLSTGEKVSKKTGGGKVQPNDLIAEYGADALRYAMCGSSLGADSTLDVENHTQLEFGRKLINKLYNSTKFTLSMIKDVDFKSFIDPEALEGADYWILKKTYDVADEMAKHLHNYDYNLALDAFENFYWNDFTLNYIEMVKGRLYGADSAAKLSAQYALFHTTSAILRMISPYMPHIAEELFHSEYQPDEPGSSKGKLGSTTNHGYFASKSPLKSIREARWPHVDEIGGLPELPVFNDGMGVALQVMHEVRKCKSEAKVSLGSPAGSIIVRCPSESARAASLFFEQDLKNATKAAQIFFIIDESYKALDVQVILVKI